MPTETLSKNERIASEPRPAIVEPEDEGALRARAVQQIHRVRAFKLHVVAFVLGMFVLGDVWVLTEYYEEHTWPSRFADSNDVAGTWSPWFFWVAGVWLLVLAIHAAKTYVRPFMRRPPTKAEVDREVERLKARG